MTPKKPKLIIGYMCKQNFDNKIFIVHDSPCKNHDSIKLTIERVKGKGKVKPGADAYRSFEKGKAILETIACHICNFCLDGVGGECHTPGCLFWMHPAPEISIRDIVKEKTR